MSATHRRSCVHDGLCALVSANQSYAKVARGMVELEEVVVSSAKTQEETRQATASKQQQERDIALQLESTANAERQDVWSKFNVSVYSIFSIVRRNIV